MRWGVGKGRFRNLTATVLSVLLALSFIVVWTFFHRIKPLTIDTSALSQTASISDRLINKEPEDSTQLRQRTVLLFHRIADSVDANFRRTFPPGTHHSSAWLRDSLPELLRRNQVQTRKEIGMVLNQSFSPIDEYRRCEAAILKELHPSEKELERYHWLLSVDYVQQAMKSVDENLVADTVSAPDRELIHEFEYDLSNRLLPFLIGLSSDRINYIELSKLPKLHRSAEVHP